MKVTGERGFEAPREAVWRVLNDPAAMAATMPGVESFDVQDDRHWRANVKIPLGLGVLGLTMDMEKTEEREPEFASLAIELLTNDYLNCCTIDLDAGTGLLPR